MKTFEYRGFDHAGRSRKGLVEALSVKEARERLAADGVLAERLSPTGLQLRLSAATRAVIYRELGALLGAGMPLVKALDILIDSPDTGDAGLCMAGVRDRVKEGVSLARALSDASPSVSGFESAIIEAAEHSASVESAMDRLAGFIEESEAVRQKIRSALVYPSIVVTVGICVAILMLGLLIPKTRDLLSSANSELPGLTAFMIGFGEAFARWGPVAIALVVAAVWTVRRRLAADRSFRCGWDRRLFSLPLVGRGYRLLVSERFARTLSILLDGGVSLVDGLPLAARATGSVWIEELAVGEAESVRHGDRLSAAVGRMPPLASAIPGWIRIGESGGGMSKLLAGAGDRCNLQWNRYVKLVLSLLEPVLILIIGGFVLLVTLSVLLPILDLSHSL